MTKSSKIKTLKKEVKREQSSERKLNNNIGRDPVSQNMEKAHQNGRQAALATLDPIAAIERGFLPGVCDGTATGSYRWSSKTQVEVTSVGSTDEFVFAQARPHLGGVLSVGLTYSALGVPLTTSVIPDPTLAAASIDMDVTRCVAMIMEVRCLNPSLTLEGNRTIGLGTHSVFNAGVYEMEARKDFFTTGNNNPGEVSRMPLVAGELRRYEVPSTTFSTDDSMIYFCSVDPLGSGVLFQITVTTIWEGLPSTSTLINPLPFVGDPSYYAAALSAALEKCPLNSHERISYMDDGKIDSTVSDVRNILENGQKMWTAGKSAANSVVRIGESVASFFGNLFENATDDQKMMIAAALLKIAEQKHVLNEILTFAEPPVTREVLLARIEKYFPNRKFGRKFHPKRGKQPLSICEEEISDPSHDINCPASPTPSTASRASWLSVRTKL